MNVAGMEFTKRCTCAEMVAVLRATKGTTATLEIDGFAFVLGDTAPAMEGQTTGGCDDGSSE